MDKTKLEISVSIWKEYYQRAGEVPALKLLREANDLCKCFGIPEDVSYKGKQIALEVTGDKNVNYTKK